MCAVTSMFSVIALGMFCLRCSAAASEDAPVGVVKLEGGGFLGRTTNTRPADEEISSVLRNSVGAVFGGWGEEASSRLTLVENLLRPAFEVQPKVEGRLGSEAARAVAYSFFAQEHGWLVKGLEPPYELHNNLELHEVSVLRKAPVVVESLIEVQKQSHGLSLGDVAAVVTTIERLLVDESVALLEAAYELNGQDEMDWINSATLDEILQSYLLIFRQGSKANLMDAAKHAELKKRAQSSGRGWEEVKQFESAGVQRYSKFMGEGSRQYSFEDAAQIARDMALRYGKWQDQECKAMSSDLQRLDVKHAGSIPLETFHKQSRNPVYGYQFTESADYLRTTGALEELDEKKPNVLIANYIIGPSNCIGTSQYLSVCCLNTCEALATEVWNKVRASSVEPDLLKRVVANLTVPLPKLTRGRTPFLMQELHDIAALQQGKVELAKPQFRQWLHRAFPSTCPSLPASVQEAMMTLPSEQAKLPTPVAPAVPPSQRPNQEDCTRMPSYFL